VKTKKGIVFEHTPSYSIFLTEDGRFQKGIPVPSAVLVGEEIEFQPYPSMIQKFSPAKKAWMAPVLAAVAIIFMFFSVLLPAQSNVLAFVQVDINPSVELGIDENGDVQHFIGLNKEGVTLKGEISFWKGKSLSNVLSTIVASSESSSQEERIEVTTIYKEKAHHKALENIITTAVAQSTKKMATEPILIKEATIEERLKANEKGISVDQFKQNVQKDKDSEPSKQKSPKVKPEKKQPKAPNEKDDTEKTKDKNKKPDQKDDTEKTKGKNNKPDQKEDTEKTKDKNKTPEKDEGKGKKPSKDSETSKGNEQKQNNSENQAKQNNQNKHTDRSNGKKQENVYKKHYKDSKPSNKGEEKNGNKKKDKNNDKAKNNKSKGDKR